MDSGSCYLLRAVLILKEGSYSRLLLSYSLEFNESPVDEATGSWSKTGPTGSRRCCVYYLSDSWLEGILQP